MSLLTRFKCCLGKLPLVIVTYRLCVAFRQIGLPFRWFAGLLSIAGFVGEFHEFRRRNDNPNFDTDFRYMYPCLLDKTELTPLEPTYFFQDCWAAGKIFHNCPAHHHDVGSSAKTIGIISQFVPTTMVDIRPIELELTNLNFIEGSILNLPFVDDSIESLSTLCVVEHIGLGRYGDPMDSWGSEKAVIELKRVLKPGGNLYFSVPVDAENRVYFNAHRAFNRNYLVALFAPFILIEERYIYGRNLCNSYDPRKGFGTGLFHFRK